MLTLRPLLGLLMALILATASVTMAVARGQSPMGLRMEICADSIGGIVTVTLDANGQPVAPLHPCPECLAGIAAFVLPEATPQPQPPQSHSTAAPSQTLLTLTGLIPPAAKARDPPSVI